MLPDAEFWGLVAMLGGRPDLQDDRPYDALTEELARGPRDRIIGFADTLAYKLYLLDRRHLAETAIPGETGAFAELSDDGFLYARCAVIVSGPEAFSAILDNTEAFGPFTTAEAAHAESILDVPSNAFTKLTGEQWDHVEPYDYETGSNTEWW